MAKNFMTAMVNTKMATPPAMYSQTEKIKKELIILENIKKFIPALSVEEKQQLEQNIIEFGCKDALTVWETTREIIDPQAASPEELCYVLIDGHNRYEICQQYGIDFKIIIVEFPTFDKVYDFMIDHQLGRRNLSPEQMSYLRGLKYNSLKKNEVQRDKSGKFLAEVLPSGQNDQTVNLIAETPENDAQNAGHLPSGQNDQTVKKVSLSEQLAEQFNVGEKTIRRDADFAKGLDLLPNELKNEVLQGKSLLNKADIIEIGKQKDSSKVGELLDKLLTKTSVTATPKAETPIIKNKAQDKIINLAKSIATPEDCDKLINEI
ncbi:MAG: hypothetical protein ACOVO2_18015, partial [Emticicia sp.]|uniref:hypothetical protein n=1 Tax=Emticicia sp. TaxID=1930953 RepID=UPI003BA5BAA7